MHNKKIKFTSIFSEIEYTTLVIYKLEITIKISILCLILNS